MNKIEKLLEIIGNLGLAIIAALIVLGQLVLLSDLLLELFPMSRIALYFFYIVSLPWLAGFVSLILLGVSQIFLSVCGFSKFLSKRKG